MDILKRYLFLYTRHRGPYFLGGVFLIATNAIALAIPRIFGWAIDDLEAGATHGLILSYAGAIVLLAVLQTVMRVGSRIFVLSVSRRIDYEMKGMLHNRLIHLAPSFFSVTNTGDLMSRMTNDVMLVRALGGPGVLYFFNAFVMYALGLAYMVSISWRLTLVVFLPLPIVAILVRILVHRVRDYVTRARIALSDLNTIVQENLSGVMVVKSFALEEAQNLRFENQSAAYMDFGLREAWTRAQMIPVVGLGGGLAAVVVIGFGGRMVSAGDLSIGDLVAVMSYVGVMVMPTVALGWILSLVQRGAAALERLDEVLTAPVTISSPDSACRIGDGPLPVVIKGLNFRYDDHLRNYVGILKLDETFESGRRHALHDIDFVAKEGGYVAIVGRVGSGKSTLLKAIQHLIEVPEGSVFVGGVDVAEVELDELRQRVGFVPQDDFLFSTTVFDNIAYGQPDATRDKVDEAAQIAGLLVDLESLPDGLHTVVGERGSTLSGGQRQRVAVARAILIDSPILLLDNALSNVDSETERKILDGLRTNAARNAGRTLVVVSNRIGAIQDADHIYVMDEGRVVNHGPHAQLIQHPGLYANMFEQQQLSAEREQF